MDWQAYKSRIRLDFLLPTTRYFIETHMRLAAFSAAFLFVLIPGQSSSLEAFCCQGKGVSAVSQSYVHKIAVFGKERRRTVEEYAQDNGLPVSAIRKRFAATGTIKCVARLPCHGQPNQMCDWTQNASAQLTLKADIITTAAHALNPDQTCGLPIAASGCTFTIEGPTRAYSIKIEKLLGAGDYYRGNQCPTKEIYSGDWAVMRLARPVPDDVKPYHVDLDGTYLQKNTPVLLVCHAMDFVRRSQTGTVQEPKYIDRCSVKDPHYHYQWHFYETDCDMSFGCSGGAVLSEEGDSLTVRGVLATGPETIESEKKAAAERRVNTLTYQQGYVWSGFTPVTGEFLNVLRKVEGLPPLKVPSTIWDDPAGKLDVKHLGRVPSMEETGIKQVGPSGGH